MIGLRESGQKERTDGQTDVRTEIRTTISASPLAADKKWNFGVAKRTVGVFIFPSQSQNRQEIKQQCMVNE